MKLDLSPFPHVYVPDFLDAKTCRSLIDNWPQCREPEGDLDRSLFELIHDDKLLDMPPFWDDAARRIVHPMLLSIAAAFGPFIGLRDRRRTIPLTIHRLMCLEAGNNFVEHTPHAHIGAKNWVFTFLLYLEDMGREDRGTTLYGIRDLNFEMERKAIYAGTQPSGRVFPAFSAPFKQGTLVAFYDCPLSIHGSTPFVGNSAGRKLLRGHIALNFAPRKHDMKAPRAFLSGKIPQRQPMFSFPAFNEHSPSRRRFWQWRRNSYSSGSRPTRPA